MKNLASIVLAVAAVLIAVFALTRGPISQPSGAAAGPDFYNLVTLYAGELSSNSVATTSQGSVTISAAEVRQWGNASQVSYSPGLVAGATLTFPASSTLASFVPKAGDRQTFCVRNATTTSNVYVTFAGGTGTNLLVASSSVSAVGSTKLITGKVGCFTAVRQAATATTFDIDFLFTAFQ